MSHPSSIEKKELNIDFLNNIKGKLFDPFSLFILLWKMCVFFALLYSGFMLILTTFLKNDDLSQLCG